MPDFCTGKIGACVDLPVNDDTAPYARAQGDAYGVVCALGSPGNKFAVCGSVCVVLHEYGLVNVLLDVLDHGSVYKAQVVGVLNDPVPAVGNAGGADADPLDLIHGQLCIFHCLDCHFCHIPCDLPIRPGAVGLGACLCQNVVLFVHDTCYNVGAAQIDAYIILHIF